MRRIGLKEPEEFIRPDDRPLCGQQLGDHISRYYFASQHVGGMRVLDVACGGCGSAYLLNRGAHRVIGADISRQVIALAKRHHKERLEAEAGYLETASPIHTASASRAIPTDVLVGERHPKKGGPRRSDEAVGGEGPV